MTWKTRVSRSSNHYFDTTPTMAFFPIPGLGSGFRSCKMCNIGDRAKAGAEAKARARFWNRPNVLLRPLSCRAILSQVP